MTPPLFHQKSRHHPIRRSGWGVVTRPNSKDIHLSKHLQRYPGSIAPCDHNAQTSQTDGQTNGHWHRSLCARCIYYLASSRDVYITSRAKNDLTADLTGIGDRSTFEIIVLYRPTFKICIIVETDGGHWGVEHLKSNQIIYWQNIHSRLQ